MLQSEVTFKESTAFIHDLGNLIQVASSAVEILARNPQLREIGLDPVICGAQMSLSRAGALVRRSMGAVRTRQAGDTVDIAAQLTEIETIITNTWNPKFRVHMRTGSGLPKLRCDPLAFESAILNLLMNARDAMPDGGDIAVGATDGDNGQVEIVVADNGAGMSEETIVRAFHPFFTTKVDGLGGIGLPSVARFAREAGGRVSLRSRLGIGTIVTLQLPGAPGKEEQNG